MVKTVKIKFVRDYVTPNVKEKPQKQTFKKGKILTCNEATAAHYVSRGAAEYVKK